MIIIKINSTRNKTKKKCFARHKTEIKIKHHTCVFLTFTCKRSIRSRAVAFTEPTEREGKFEWQIRLICLN